MQSLLEEIDFRNPTRARRDAQQLPPLTPSAAGSIKSLLETVPDPDEALHFLERFWREAPDSFERVCQSPAVVRSLLTIFSYSAFLSEAVIRHPEWLLELDGSEDMHRVLPVDEYVRRLSGQQGVPRFATFRRQQLLRIVLRDALGLATLAEVTEELSNLADAILAIAWQRVREDAEQDFRKVADGPSPLEFSILSLGKLGGRELNYSSDIDLMFLYSGNGAELFKRAAREFTESLSTYTDDGVCYRVDLRLRPDGRYGEICQSLEGAHRYYQDRARDWELQMLMKARVSAGDAGPGKQFLELIEPRIYSGAFDFPATGSVWETRERVQERLRRSPRGGLDVKLTPGGIRDIEFLAQSLQRVHGGTEQWVRHGGTQTALLRLREKGFISGADYGRLQAAYEFLRNLEHRLQFHEDRQTHILPAEMSALDLLARKMPTGSAGSAEVNAGTLERALDEHLGAVRQIHERAVHFRSEPLRRRAIAQSGDASVEPFEAFLEQLAAEPQWLRYLEQNQEAHACVGELFRYSRFFAGEFVRHPELVAEVVKGSGARQGRAGFAPAKDVPGLRRFFREQMVRIQSDSVYRRAPIFKTLKRTSGLADSVIEGAYRIGTGDPAANQMMVIALGRLGMGEFDLASDADLIFVIPDRCAPETKFWTDVAERIVQAIGEYTGDGVLFTVDTRLRPNGREGALVQTESTYKDYFASHAEAWEGISYMKARAVAGDRERATQFLQDLQKVDWRRYGQNGRSRKELAGMRARLEKEQGARNPLKAGPGGYYDIDFALLYFRLKGAGMFYKTLNTPERIDIVEKMGHLEREDAVFLREAATFYRAIDHGLRVTTGHAEGRLPTAPGDLAVLTQLLGKWEHGGADGRRVEERLRGIQLRTRRFYEGVFG